MTAHGALGTLALADVGDGAADLVRCRCGRTFDEDGLARHLAIEDAA